MRGYYYVSVMCETGYEVVKVCFGEYEDENFERVGGVVIWWDGEKPSVKIDVGYRTDLVGDYVSIIKTIGEGTTPNAFINVLKEDGFKLLPLERCDCV